MNTKISCRKWEIWQQLSDPYKGIGLWERKVDREIKCYNITRKENKINKEPMQPIHQMRSIQSINDPIGFSFWQCAGINAFPAQVWDLSTLLCLQNLSHMAEPNKALRADCSPDKQSSVEVNRNLNGKQMFQWWGSCCRILSSSQWQRRKVNAFHLNSLFLHLFS